MRNLPENESGQALLLVLLSMAVVLIVILSILSRSITDLSITSADESSLRAFSAAEAGVERALIAGSGTGVPVSIGDASFITNVTSFSAGSKEFSYPINLAAGEEAVIWFVAHDEDGNLDCSGSDCFTGGSLKICWGKEGSVSETTPALELSVVYAATPADYSTIQIGRETVDPNDSRRLTNLFGSDVDAGPCEIDGTIYAFQKTVGLADLGIPAPVLAAQNGLQYASVRLFYNTGLTEPVGVSGDFGGNTLFPSQGIKIISQGSAGEANRKVEVFQSYAETPLVFNMAVFSQGGIVQ